MVSTSTLSHPVNAPSIAVHSSKLQMKSGLNMREYADVSMLDSLLLQVESSPYAVSFPGNLLSIRLLTTYYPGAQVHGYGALQVLEISQGDEMTATCSLLLSGVCQCCCKFAMRLSLDVSSVVHRSRMPAGLLPVDFFRSRYLVRRKRPRKL